MFMSVPLRCVVRNKLCQIPEKGGRTSDFMTLCTTVQIKRNSPVP